MRRKCFVLLLVIPWLAHAQDTEVQETVRTLEGANVRGTAVYLPLEYRYVKKKWARQLREWGKTKQQQGAYFTEVALIPQVSLSAVRVVSTVERSDTGAVVFYVLSLADSTGTAAIDPQATAQVLYNFAVATRRAAQQERVDAAERALRVAESRHGRLIDQDARLMGRRKRNARLREDLTEKLAKNAEEIEELRAALPPLVATADTAEAALTTARADSTADEATLKQLTADARRALRARNRAREELARSEARRRRWQEYLVAKKSDYEALGKARVQNEKDRAAALAAIEVARARATAARRALAEIR